MPEGIPREISKNAQILKYGKDIIRLLNGLDNIKVIVSINGASSLRFAGDGATLVLSATDLNAALQAVNAVNNPPEEP